MSKVRSIFGLLYTIVRMCKSAIYQSVSLHRWKRSVNLFLAWNPLRAPRSQKYLTHEVIVTDPDGKPGSLHSECVCPQEKSFLGVFKRELEHENFKKDDRYGLNYACDFCEKRFESKLKVRRHSGVHVHCVFTCPSCGEEVKTRSKLEEHVAKEHPYSIHRRRSSTSVAH